jgi:hypothetical protein
MGRKWGANIKRHLIGKHGPEISDERAARIADDLSKPEAVRDLQTVSGLLESLEGPQPWAIREAMAIARRWAERKDG